MLSAKHSKDRVGLKVLLAVLFVNWQPTATSSKGAKLPGCLPFMVVRVRVAKFLQRECLVLEVMLGKLMLAQQMPRVHVSVIMSHKRPSSQPPPGSKQIRLEALMKGGMSKTALVSVLQDLHQAGLLEQRFNIKQVRKAVRAHSTAQTPYGSVIKRFEFDARFE